MAAKPGSVLLIQFARAPVVGGVKTRMQPVLSAAQACELHCELTLWTARRLLACGLGAVELSVAGDTAHALFDQCRAAGVSRVSQQHGDDLGQRMHHAIHNALGEFEKVVLVGSDCPDIDTDYLRRALAALDQVDVVLGPASDGGYVLIGARAIQRSVFQAIPWGTGEVYAKTLAALACTTLGHTSLSVLQDIDLPEDLPIWEALRGKADAVPQSAR